MSKLTPKQREALATLADAFGSANTKPPVTKELAGRVLGELLGVMAGGVTFQPERDKHGRFVPERIDHGPTVAPSSKIVINSREDAKAVVTAFVTGNVLPERYAPPEGTALHELHKLTSDEETDEASVQTPAPGHVRSEPSAEMQEAQDVAMARAFEKHAAKYGLKKLTTDEDEE